MNVIEQLSLVGLVPVIKVEDANDAVPLCKALADGGLLAFETGCTQGDAVREILSDNGFHETEILRDLGGNPRVVLGRK